MVKKQFILLSVVVFMIAMAGLAYAEGDRPELQVNGISYDQGGRSSAIVNGKVVVVGDKIGNVEVAEINAHSVKFKQGNGFITGKLSKNDAPPVKNPVTFKNTEEKNLRTCSAGAKNENVAPVKQRSKKANAAVVSGKYTHAARNTSIRDSKDEIKKNQDKVRKSWKEELRDKRKETEQKRDDCGTE